MVDAGRDWRLVVLGSSTFAAKRRKTTMSKSFCLTLFSAPFESAYHGDHARFPIASITSLGAM